jgi:hypothetical protein
MDSNIILQKMMKNDSKKLLYILETKLNQEQKLLDDQDKLRI